MSIPEEHLREICKISDERDELFDELIISLGWPLTLPSNIEEGYELMRAVVDTSCPDLKLCRGEDGLQFTGGEPKIHVAIAYERPYAEDWGTQLALIARAIAEQHANYLVTERDDGDLVAGIRDGFIMALEPKAP